MKIERSTQTTSIRVLKSPVTNPFKDGRRDGPDWVPTWAIGTRFVLRRWTETQEIDTGDGGVVESIYRRSELRPIGGYNSLVRIICEQSDKVVSNAEQADLHVAILNASEPVSDFDALITICAQENVSGEELLRSMWSRGIVGPHTIEQARLDTLERWDAEDAS